MLLGRFAALGDVLWGSSLVGRPILENRSPLLLFRILLPRQSALVTFFSTGFARISSKTISQASLAVLAVTVDDIVLLGVLMVFV